MLLNMIYGTVLHRFSLTNHTLAIALFYNMRVALIRVWPGFVVKLKALTIAAHELQARARRNSYPFLVSHLSHYLYA
jgi:hypothetical protein